MTSKAIRHSKRRWIALWLAVAAAIPLFALMIVRLQGPQIERETYAMLEAVAHLKAQQVEYWLNERQGNSQMYMLDDTLKEAALDLQRPASARAHLLTQQRIQQRLAALQEALRYAGVILLDPRGIPLLAQGEGTVALNAATRFIDEVLTSDKVQISPVYIDETDGATSLNYYVPLQRIVNGGKQAIGVLVLHVHLDQTIFPLIMSWPSPSPSGEVLLARPDGDSLVFISKPRHDMQSSLSRMIPLAGSQIPAAIALRDGKPGKAETTDYRNIEVLAAYRPIERTDWIIAAKIDRSEAMAPLWRLVFWGSLALLLVLLAISALLVRAWRQQSSYQELAAEYARLELLRESEARYRAITQTAHEAIVTADSQGIIVDWNPAAAALFGSTAAEAIGQSLTLIIPPHFRESSMRGFARMMDGDSKSLNGTRFELSALHRDGYELLVELSVSLWTTASGRFATYTSRDIGEQKQAEAAHEAAHQSLQAQEKKMRELLAINNTTLQNAMVGIAYLRHGTILSCNPRFDEIFGCTPGEFIGRSIEFHASYPIFRDIGVRAYAAFAAGATSYSEEALLARASGESFWGAISGRVVDPEHPYRSSIWIIADITEKRIAEHESQKFRKGVEQAPVSIVITDSEGAIEYVNPTFTQISGYSASEVLGKNPRLVQSGVTPLQVYRHLWQTILSERVWRGTLCNRRKDGELIWENTSISPIKDEEGKITHFIAVKEDVTERLRVAEQLEKHQTQLENLVRERTAQLSEALDAAKITDRTKDEFLANISHELRTPLSAMIGFSNLARPLSRDPQQRDYLDKVVAAGRTLSGIINNLLDLSKIAAGGLELESIAFRLSDMITRSQSVMAWKAEEKALKLRVAIADDVPDILVGDPLRMVQIILNLLSNAIKFTSVGHVVLSVSMLERQEERVHLQIEVEDTGIGMNEDQVALLFKPFSQTDSSISRRFGGTGLGLAICKRLSELMGGEISVSSQEGAGSVFRTRLWFGLGDASDLPEDREAERKEARTLRYKHARVLVVDDQPANREIVMCLLGAVGITPSLAGNGQEAVEMLLAAGPNFYDMVLMDVQMPVLDGLSATRELRARAEFAGLPIVAMTAHTMVHQKQKYRIAGMSDFIGKPFDEATFHRVLSKWIPPAKQFRPALSIPASSLPAAAAARDDTGGKLPALTGVDTEAGIALMLGDEARYRHWLSKFAEDAPGFLAQARGALAASQSEPAAVAVHTLKGRAGMLGMKSLHALAARLEMAIDSGGAAGELLSEIERATADLCAEIVSVCGDRKPQFQASAPAEALSDFLPEGPIPSSVQHLLALLDAGDGDSDRALAACLAQHQGTAWESRLLRAKADVESFRFAEARDVLTSCEA